MASTLLLKEAENVGCIEQVEGRQRQVSMLEYRQTFKLSQQEHVTLHKNQVSWQRGLDG
jgi:hypothetical protein